MKTMNNNMVMPCGMDIEFARGCDGYGCPWGHDERQCMASPIQKMEGEIINLTPHDVNLIGKDDKEIATFPSRGVVRCSTNRRMVGMLNGISINKTLFGEVTGLPDEKEGTYYIVSALVANACPNRHDLLLTDDAVRDDQGRIIGCKALAFPG